jgi:uncharacterized delta-60 repeat protein
MLPLPLKQSIYIRALFLLLTCLPAAGSFAQPGTNDATFNPGDLGLGLGDGPNGTVNSIALQTDGKILIGGAFSTYNGATRNGMARLERNGSLETAFNPQTSGSVYTFAIQSDKKILAGGFFTIIDNTTRSYIARMDSNGVLDISFEAASVINSSVNSIALQNDGKILAVGNFIVTGSPTYHGIARLNSNGIKDITFEPGTGSNSNLPINAVALQGSSKILIAGAFTAYNGTGRNRIARLSNSSIQSLATGSLSTGTFCAGSPVSVPFTATGSYNGGNVFTAQLSDATGSFAAPVTSGKI